MLLPRALRGCRENAFGDRLCARLRALEKVIRTLALFLPVEHRRDFTGRVERCPRRHLHQASRPPNVAQSRPPELLTRPQQSRCCLHAASNGSLPPLIPKDPRRPTPGVAILGAAQSPQRARLVPGGGQTSLGRTQRSRDIQSGLAAAPPQPTAAQQQSLDRANLMLGQAAAVLPRETPFFDWSTVPTDERIRVRHGPSHQ